MRLICPQFSNLIEYQTSWTSHVSVGRGLRHNHAYVELDFHQSGSGVVLADDNQEISFSPYQLELMPAARYHTQVQSKSGIDCCILFSMEEILPKGLPQPISLKLREGDSLIPEIQSLALLPRSENSTERQIYNLRTTAVLFRIFTLAGLLQVGVVSRDRREQLARDAYDFVRTHWRSIQTIAQIASELSISPDYLRHVFQEYVGMTIHDCLTRMRIDHAKDMLLNSQLPQKQIARACGFADIQQFSRRFKQVTKLAPGSYRKSVRR